MQERDLRYFKKILSDQMEHLISKDNQTVDELCSLSSMVPDSVDQAANEAGLAFRLRIRDRELGLVRKIREALIRIEEKTYGICERCGEEIALNRLKARPVTTYCIVCKSRQETGEKAIEMNQIQTDRWTTP